LFGKLVSAIMPDHDGIWSEQVSGQHLDIALAVTQSPPVAFPILGDEDEPIGETMEITRFNQPLCGRVPLPIAAIR
jgi:hypothetical protein